MICSHRVCLARIRIVSTAWMLACVTSAWVSIASASDFFVATDGNDAHAGTSAQPFATLTRAADAVRAARSAHPNRDRPIVVSIRGGRWALREPIVLGPTDSGAASSPTIYRAEPGHSPVFSGGQIITGWRVGDDGLWRVTLDDVKAGRWSFVELFVDGQRRTRARFPNSGYLRVDQIGDDARTNFTWSQGDLPLKQLHAQAELVFLHDWSISRIRIASIDPAKRRLTTANPVGCAARHYAMNWFEKHPRYFLENDPAFIDEAGEWHLNTSTGVLTCKPMPGESPDKVTVVAPRATQLFALRGQADRPVAQVRIEGLTFEHCNWLPPRKGYAEGQAAFHEPRDGSGGGGLRAFMPAAVAADFAQNVTFANCTVRHVGGTGLWIGRSAKSCIIERCHVRDVAGNGVMIGEGTVLPVDATATGNTLRDSIVEHCGQRYFGAVGVWVGITRGTVIEYNTIAHLPYTGVSIGWRWNPDPTPAQDNHIRHNHIHHVMQILSDGGGIYSLGRQPGSTLAHNLIHDVPLNAGRAESNGMFLDEGTTDLTIEHNTIFGTTRSPLRFHRADRNLVHLNTLVVPKGVPPVRYNATPEANITLQDNRVMEASTFSAERDAGEARRAVGPRQR